MTTYRSYGCVSLGCCVDSVTEHGAEVRCLETPLSQRFHGSCHANPCKKHQLGQAAIARRVDQAQSSQDNKKKVDNEVDQHEIKALVDQRNRGHKVSITAMQHDRAFLGGWELARWQQASSSMVCMPLHLTDIRDSTALHIQIQPPRLATQSQLTF